MIRRPPRSTRTDTLFPYTTLFRSSILGAPFLVMGKVDGRAATQKPNYNVEGWLVDLSPEERGDVWRNAIHAFAKLHRIEWRDGFEFLNQPERGEPGLEQYLNYMEERSEERRVGKERVRTCRSRWEPKHKKKKK